MSDQPWFVKAQIPPIPRPEFVLGAATPLWGYFAAAAVSGTAWWWMTRWMRTELVPTVPAKAAGPRLVLVSENTALVPVGGESAPIPPAVLEGELLDGPELDAELAAAPIAQPKPAPRRRAKGAEPKPN
ncbi:hypothetical protein LJR219_001322 [Phenylobacterium sp. LjRoot219]|uniref:hypothetical protein n=1 Tax=Phenylobacterium sp. LjRoot219 TaxID=3342283 RepID=UPI003ED0B060